GRGVRRGRGRPPADVGLRPAPGRRDGGPGRDRALRDPRRPSPV
ncbi:MAG: hypothetical protein AVDCRST_MAG54-1109, partial [uncultured Actinomycetospora sp.]